MKLLKSPYLSACVAVLTSLSAFFCWMILDYHYMVDYFVEENGPVENVTLVAYVVALAAILYYGSNVLFVRTRLALTIMLAYMFMREADMHKWLNGLSILKIKFWLSGDIPLVDKFWAVVILAPVLWMLYYFLKNYVRQVWTDFWRKDAYAISVFVFLAVLVISKICDRSLNMMTEMWGWQFDIWLKALVTAQEEFLECILPVLVMIGVLQYRESHEWKPGYVESARIFRVSCHSDLIDGAGFMGCFTQFRYAEIRRGKRYGGKPDPVFLCGRDSRHCFRADSGAFFHEAGNDCHVGLHVYA